MNIQYGRYAHVTMWIRPKHVLRTAIIPMYVLFSFSMGAQEQHFETRGDTILPINLEEVIIISNYTNALEHHTHHKPLSTLDEYLESSQKVNMIKRGAYAWEPVLNDMASERLSITIDGMRIFGACTDKMDPVTSYVDVSNLSEVHVSSGQQGAENGSTIGGAIDMKLEKGNFRPTGLIGSLEMGGESGNNAQIIGAEVNYSEEKLFVDTDIIYRKAENYDAGGGEEVAYSQFEKLNLSSNLGYKMDDGKRILSTFIFDEANDVGYPALTMDVSLARAFIGSVSWVQDDFVWNLSDWETKLYANTVTHIMDDSKRPDVPIRMDMPGWSDTYGFYSQAKLRGDKHQFLFKWDGFYNKSLAEMTMYPNNPDEKPMFMLTWPDVHTLNAGLYAEDAIALWPSTLKLSTRIAMQNSNVNDAFGLNSLRIFYPNMAKAKTRYLKSVSARLQRKFDLFNLDAGLAYGDRAPSVTEGFGFYLFNSFDNHDYIGNPDLKNEKSVEANIKLTKGNDHFKVGVEGNFFRVSDYIIGEIDPSLSVMTVGADGVKIYRNLAYADLYNVSFNSEYGFLQGFRWTGVISYHRGTDAEGGNLPFISPLAYSSSLHYAKNGFSGTLTLRGNGEQVHYNPTYGEDGTNAYAVLSLTLGNRFVFNDNSLFARIGVENIFDEYYSTYSDWKNIPRMGRNFFATVSYAFN